MTIDEAIKKEEEIAIQQIEKANAIDNIPLFGMSENDIEEIKECYKFSKEHEQLAEWLKELKQLREQTRWIPVSERLPEEDGRYLVTCKIGFSLNEDIEHDKTVDMAFYKDGHWSKYILYENIYAWMPLPEKYEVSLTEAESEDKE